ncbi:hypothetical protein E2320_022815, partial [Naja naja]
AVGTQWAPASTSRPARRILAEAEALEAPTVDEEALAELELPEGDPKLSRVTCPTFRAFPWRSYNTFPLLYPAQEYSGGEEEEQSPSEESWGFGTTPLELPSREVEQVYPSWLPHFDESEEDTDLSVSPLAGHKRLLPSDNTEVESFVKSGSEACPFACPLTTVSGPPSQLQGVFGVAHDEEGEPGGLQSQLPTSSPEDDMKTIESDQMIPALLLPFRGSLLFESESMDIMLYPQGEATKNDRSTVWKTMTAPPPPSCTLSQKPPLTKAWMSPSLIRMTPASPQTRLPMIARMAWSRTPGSSQTKSPSPRETLST